MIRQALTQYPYAIAACFVLLTFFGVFVGTFLYSYRKGSTQLYEEVSQIPLQDS